MATISPLGDETSPPLWFLFCDGVLLLWSGTTVNFSTPPSKAMNASNSHSNPVARHLRLLFAFEADLLLGAASRGHWCRLPQLHPCAAAHGKAPCEHSPQPLSRCLRAAHETTSPTQETAKLTPAATTPNRSVRSKSSFATIRGGARRRESCLCRRRRPAFPEGPIPPICCTSSCISP
jgi:hypothetical protein